jgi:hypothetical protein
MPEGKLITDFAPPPGLIAGEPPLAVIRNWLTLVVVILALLAKVVVYAAARTS